MEVTYDVTFHDGTQLEAKCVAMDAFHDVALLKVDPSKLPPDARALPLVDLPKGKANLCDFFTQHFLNRNVFLIGGSGGYGYANIDATVVEVKGDALRLSARVAGGASGSPIVTLDGRVIGIEYAGNSEANVEFAVPSPVITRLLRNYHNPSLLVEKFMGASVTVRNLTEITRNWGISEEEAVKLSRSYIAQHPWAKNNVLFVMRTKEDTPASKLLNPGDVIVAVNGEDVAGDVYKMKSLATSSKKPIVVTVYRGNAKKKNITIGSIPDVQPIKRVLELWGGLIYDTDLLNSCENVATGRPILNVLIPGSPLYAVVQNSPGDLTAEIVTIDDKPVEKLDDIIKLLPHLTRKSSIQLQIRIASSYDPRPIALDLRMTSPEDWHAKLYVYDTKNHTTVAQKKPPQQKKTPRKKVVGLALQGGGSHGAFTWGVVDALLEDGRLDIEGVSGTSAGGMNAVAIIQGLMRDGLNGARQGLNDLWDEIAMSSLSSPLKPNPIDTLCGYYNLDRSPGYWMSNMMQMFCSPYMLNPLGLNPLEPLVRKLFDFDALQAYKERKLFLCATHVKTGKLKNFSLGELTPDVLLGSACLPFLFQSIEVKGGHYWDGGFVGNPAIYPLIYGCDTQDFIVIQLTVMNRMNDSLPVTAQEIKDRHKEITYNACLMREMRAIDFISQLIEKGKLDLKKVNMHLIKNEEVFRPLHMSSALNTDRLFLEHLYHEGRKTGQDWLKENFDKIGHTSSFDIAENFVDEQE
eukprot:g8575.t1